jgi:hypothetical protein
MFGSPEIYLQAEMRYRHEQIRGRFVDADVRRRRSPVHPRISLSRRRKASVASAAR